MIYEINSFYIPITSSNLKMILEWPSRHTLSDSDSLCLFLIYNALGLHNQVKSKKLPQTNFIFAAITVTPAHQGGHFRALLTNFPATFLFSAHCWIWIFQGLRTPWRYWPYSQTGHSTRVLRLSTQEDSCSIQIKNGLCPLSCQRNILDEWD